MVKYLYPKKGSTRKSSKERQLKEGNRQKKRRKATIKMFNGEAFYVLSEHKTKKVAKAKANVRAKMGYKVRVVDSMLGYAVYSRKK